MHTQGEIVRPLLNKWLDHVVKPLLTTAKKGGLGIGELLVRTPLLCLVLLCAWPYDCVCV